MLKAMLYACVCFGCLVSVAVPSAGQEIIHALTGSVTSINPAAKTITLLQDNGSTHQFQQVSDPKPHISFDKKIEEEATPVDAFKGKGAYVIAFYFGGARRPRTVVALKNLGAGPFTAAVGTVENFEDHAHTLSVKDKSGKIQTFKINESTVAETTFGAVNGFKFDAHKGDRVRVVAETGEKATAVFVRDN